MDEPTALAIIAVRAVETADRERALWTEADRAGASRAAAEVLGEAAEPETFIARRAQLALERLAASRSAVARAARAWRWRPWVSGAVLLAALAFGVAGNVVGGWRQINILYSPIAPLVLWNLLVYLALLLGRFVPHGQSSEPRSRPLQRFIVALAGGARRARHSRDEVTATALTAFADDWRQRAAPLYAARAARLLHYAAAALAAGLIAGLYVRGLGLEFRATWESTFLSASAVRAIAAVLYAPGAWVTGLSVPDLAGIEAIAQPQSQNAALWVHLMAATLACVVILPRLLLGFFAGIVERHRERHLIEDFNDPYFQRLLRGYHRGALRVTVMPYSYTAPEQTIATLTAILERALGSQVDVNLAASIAYGEEDADIAPAPNAAAPPLLCIVLFNSVATPENAAHGRLLKKAASDAGKANSGDVIALIDESTFNARSGEQAQREARRALWRQLAHDAGVPAMFVDLTQPDIAQAEAEFDAALAQQ
ncbi:MAG: DUF2868 domain-containing protein [Nevskiaceae bacterium]|jgi:hypothetical protein|nr:DUF2868 domain-containing protein [Nevskiaceae bacterium]